MTSVEIIGIISAASLLVGGLVAGVLSILKAFAEFRAAVNRVDTKADVIAATTAKIDGHVNSEKTAADGREHALKREIELLREAVVKADRAAELLAQTVATRSRVEPAGPPPTPADATLKQIEINTEATAENTRVDSKTQRKT